MGQIDMVCKERRWPTHPGSWSARLLVVACAGIAALLAVFVAPSASQSAPVEARINFQPQTSSVPAGYTGDFGQAYGAVRGFGWVAPGTSDPIDLTRNTRERTSPTDQRLRTMVLMQGSPTNAELNKGSWEYDLPDGSYAVTVSVGDSSFFDGTDGIDVEGRPIIPVFQRTKSETHRTGSGNVAVSDGKLTVEATGTNTKINYIDISGPLPPPGNAEVEIVNPDNVPFPDRQAFSRIQTPEDGTRLKPNGACCVPPNFVHDTSTVRVKNTGTDPLDVTGLPLTGPWELTDQISLPTTIPAGGHLDVGVRFVAQDNGAQNGLHNGSLTVQSNDADEPSARVELSGFWQSVSEGFQEPTVAEMVKVFGYKTTITASGQRLNKNGRIQVAGEEVLSPYWQLADTSGPVTVTQLAAYHSQGNTATVYWTNKGQKNGTAVLTHKGVDGQTVLPRNATSNAVARASFTPTPQTFGFQVDNEYSDPTLNPRQIDYNNGCPEPEPGKMETCGHHVRFWPARDRSGELIPDTYIMIMDYAGINYDYNDNVYLIENVKPAEPQALYRLDVGGSTVYRDSAMDRWETDTGLYAPDTAPSEGANVSPSGIANTVDDVLYRTYRGNVGNVPLAERVLRYGLPTHGLQRMDLKLHFAERFSGNNAAGKRVFDIEAEGALLRDNYDIFAAAGGLNRATTLRFNDLEVTDGALNLAFRAEVDHPSVAAIEVFCPNVCPQPTPDYTAPAPPANLVANPLLAGVGSSSVSQVALDWDDSTDTDLAGYAVFSATSSTGKFKKVHHGLLSASEYSDHWVTAGKPQFYRVMAIDKMANKSDAATVNVTMPSPSRTVAWQGKAHQPFKTYEAQGVGVGGKLYSFGGFDSTKACCTPTKRAYVYTPATNVWSPIADLPHTNSGGVTHAGTATDGQDIYLAGGYIADATGKTQIFGTKEVYRYNVASNTYDRLPDLPVAIAAGALEFLDGKLHYVGGTNLARTQDLGTHYVLDLSDIAAGWSTEAPMPNPRHHVGATVLGGKLYAVGGQKEHDDDLIPQDDVHAYDPTTGTWTEVASLPKPRNHASASVVTLNGQIFVVGGQVNHNQSLSDVTSYDPVSDKWTELTPLTAPRFSGVAGVLAGKIYYTAGSSGGGAQKTTFVGTPK